MGILALAGGNEFRANCELMDRDLLARLGKARPRVVILPTAANEHPDLAAAHGVRYFNGLGAEASAVMVVDRTGADDPALARAVSSADLVYLAGGDPGYLLSTLRDSVVEGALRDLLTRGGAIAGSSAGAMLLGEWQRDFRRSGWTPSLGLAEGVAVWPHFHGRDGIHPTEVRGSLPSEITLLGIAEATACVTEDGLHWQVAGVGEVTVIADREAARYVHGDEFTPARTAS